MLYARFGAGASPSASSVCAESTLVGSLLGVIMTLLFTLASMLSKEHGITMPIMCVIWDAYIATNTSILEFFSFFQNTRNKGSTIQIEKRYRQCQLFIFRTILLAAGTVSMILWRVSKNGDSEPDFVCEQNPAACEPNRVYRFFHFSYLWCFNFWLMLYPFNLCPDWSCESIPLMDETWATDARFPLLMLLWFVMIAFLTHAISSAIGIPKKAQVEAAHKSNEADRRVAVTSFIWMLLPFLMSSNLIVYVGFVVADRTLYLPSFGFCLLLVKGLLDLMDRSKQKPEKAPMRRNATVMMAIVLILTSYTMAQQAQTKRWSKNVLIWGEAYRINPNSCISGMEYGASLVNDGRNIEAMQVLKSTHRLELASNWFTRTLANRAADLDGDNVDDNENRLMEITRMENILSSRFKLVTAMGNAGHCDKARSLIDEGLAWIAEIDYDLRAMQVTEERNTRAEELIGLNWNNKAYLLVARSRCSENLADMIKHAYAAVAARPNLDYATNHAQSVSQISNKAGGIDPETLQLIWTTKEGSQSANLSFGFAAK